jgi:hypothetical protein
MVLAGSHSLNNNLGVTIMSFFNINRTLHDGSVLTSGLADTRYAHDDVHDAELGRSTRFHTPLQREYYLKRHPEMVGKLPPVDDPNRPTTWDASSRIFNDYGCEPANLQKKYERIASQSALLRDPVTATRRVEPTKPAPVKPEPSLVRTAVHEIGHYLWLRALKMPYARITVEPSGNILGSIVTPALPNDLCGLMVAVAGAECERVMFGDTRGLMGGDKENAYRIANAIAADEGMTPDELIEVAREEAYDRLKEVGAQFLSRFAFTLVRRKHIDFEDIDVVADACFKDVARDKAADREYVTR